MVILMVGMHGWPGRLGFVSREPASVRGKPSCVLVLRGYASFVVTEALIVDRASLPVGTSGAVLGQR